MTAKDNPRRGDNGGGSEEDMTASTADFTGQDAGKPTAADVFATPDDLGPSRADCLTKLLASVPTSNDDADLTAYLRDLTAHGLAVLFIAPGQKVPADMRSPKERREADEAAQDAAKAAGRADWTSVKAPAGVHLASSDPEVLARYLAKYRTAYGDVPVNLAVAVGPSRLVIVDADTAPQVDAFLTDAGMVGEPPTVRSPGARNAEGTWVHSDGGHYWFALEDGGELPADGTGSTTATGDYAVLWRDRYVLIPPSVRAEGAYTVTGRVHALPESVRATIAAAVTTRLEARERASVPGALADDIDAWAESVPWSEILEPRGWTLAARPDRCGCDTWTAPGEHASPKSATTHETGCTLGTYSVVNAPMHVWTDNPGGGVEEWVRERGSKTLSKLQTVAALYFGGDVGAVMAAQDLTGEPYGMNAPEGKAEGKVDEEDDDTGDVVAECYYPAGFWESRESLRRIRDLALAYRSAPEATLGAVMARLSAHMPPSVEVDTGIASPVPMNMVVGVTSKSGKGKTSVLKASKKIVEFELSWSTDPLDLDKAPVKFLPGENFPREGKIRSGEGIAEMFWDRVTESDPNSKRDRVVRRRVRSNVLMVTDEGSGLVKHIQDEKQTVGETIREAWNRMAIGQSNGTAETYRYVPEGSYSLGVLVGFQLSVAAGLLGSREVIEGTPQRFLFTWCKPNPEHATFERVSTLGKLWRSGELAPLTIVVPSAGLRLCETLQVRIDREHFDNWLADDDDDASIEGDIRSQRTSMVARTAGLLAIIDGRTETDQDGYLTVNEEDWTLAEVMFDRSCVIADLAVSDKRKRDALRKRKERARDLADRIEDEETMASPVGRAKGRIVGRLTGAGRVKWSGKGGVRAALFNNATVKDGDAALAELGESGRVRKTTVGRSEYVELIA
ncbi:bifunctional DNA primase/polymerase [Rhodococcus zopfii]